MQKNVSNTVVKVRDNVAVGCLPIVPFVGYNTRKNDKNSTIDSISI